MTLVWKLKLKHPQQAVALAMADHANDEGGEVFPSAGLIAWKSGYSKRQVQRIIDGMEEVGLLEVVAEARGWRPTEYRICFEVAEAKKPYEASKKGRGAKVAPQAEGSEGRQPVAPVGRQDDAPPTADTESEMSPPGATFEGDRGDIQVSPRTIEPSKEPPLGEDQPAAVLLRDELVRLSNQLADAIKANDPKADLNPNGKSWLDPLRLLIDRDGRTVEEVAAVIDWCQSDDFESRNVLCPSKLRKRFTELLLKAQRDGQLQPANSTPIAFRQRGGPNRLTEIPDDPELRSLAEQPVTAELTAEWAPIAAELLQATGDDVGARAWLTPLHLHDSSDGQLVLGCPATHTRWVQDRFGRLISEVAGKPIRIIDCRCEPARRAA